MRVCKSCKIELPLNEFANAGTVNGKRYYRHKCKACYAQQKLTYKHHQKNKYIDYKKTLKCERCNNDDYRVLQFHHISDDKEYDVANMWGGFSFDTMLKEIEKCNVYCANCHLIIHHEERENGV